LLTATLRERSQAHLLDDGTRVHTLPLMFHQHNQQQLLLLQ
jgi:hypothetical protein